MGKFEVETALKTLVSEGKNLLAQLKAAPELSHLDLKEEVDDWIDGYADLVDELACTTSPVEIIAKLGELADLHQSIKQAASQSGAGTSNTPRMSVLQTNPAAV